MNTSSCTLRLAFGALMLTAFHLSTALAEENPIEENGVLDLAPLIEDGLKVRFLSSTALPLHVDRGAGRILDVLAPKQLITVLAMDQYGLQVRGRGRNGDLTGWIGQKQAFGHTPAQLAILRAFYQRQLEVARLVRTGSPAIGMNLAELKRILGKPTTHTVGATDAGSSESLVWVIKKPVDLNELLATGTDQDLLKMEVEVGRVEVVLVDGLAKSIQRNVDGGAAAIPTIAPPVPDPFGPAPKENLAGK